MPMNVRKDKLYALRTIFLGVAYVVTLRLLLKDVEFVENHQEVG